MSLKIVCSNCNKNLGIKKCDKEGISHGLCIPCTIELYSGDFSKEELKEICNKEAARIASIHVSSPVV